MITFLKNFVRRFIKSGGKKRVTLDTNILFSHIFFHSKITEKFFDIIYEKFELCLFDYVIDEIDKVAERKMPEKAFYVMAYLKEIPYTVLSSSENLDNIPHIRDEKDKPILAAAIASDVDYLITGDKDFLVLDIKKPKILTMKEFTEMFS